MSTSTTFIGKVELVACWGWGCPSNKVEPGASGMRSKPRNNNNSSPEICRMNDHRSKWGEQAKNSSLVWDRQGKLEENNRDEYRQQSG